MINFGQIFDEYANSDEISVAIVAKNGTDDNIGLLPPGGIRNKIRQIYTTFWNHLEDDGAGVAILNAVTGAVYFSTTRDILRRKRVHLSPGQIEAVEQFCDDAEWSACYVLVVNRNTSSFMKLYICEGEIPPHNPN